MGSPVSTGKAEHFPFGQILIMDARHQGGYLFAQTAKRSSRQASGSTSQVMLPGLQKQPTFYISLENQRTMKK